MEGYFDDEGNQRPTRRGELVFNYNTAYAMELDVTYALPEWGGQDIRIVHEPREMGYVDHPGVGVARVEQKVPPGGHESYRHRTADPIIQSGEIVGPETTTRQATTSQSAGIDFRQGGHHVAQNSTM